MAIEHPTRDPVSKNKVKDSPARETNASSSRDNAGSIDIFLEKSVLKLKAMPQEGRAAVSNEQVGKAKPVDLEQRIKKKVLELIDKEETLVDLYKKAAEAAKKTEEEFKDRTAVLMRQIEKDKSLIEILKRLD